MAAGMFDGLDPGIDGPDGEGRKRGEEPSPCQDGEGEFVDPFLADSSCCPSFGKEFGDQPGIIKGDSAVVLIP